MDVRKLRCAAVVGTVTMLLAGCSGPTPGNALAAPAGLAQSAGIAPAPFPELSASGIDPAYFDRIHAAFTAPAAFGSHATCRSAWRCGNLYVGDIALRGVTVLNNQYYTPNGKVVAPSPNGVWADAAHNLYVANMFTGAGNGYIQENACTITRCSREPKSFYRSELFDPVSVTTDSHGNVYAVDFAVGNILEYPQGVDKPSASCALLGQPEGIAVDSSTGNVFVSFNRLHTGLIIEFPHELKPCQGRVLGPHLLYAGGIILDPEKKLVVTDQAASEVDIIPPPYNRIGRKCGSGFVDPLHVALTKRHPRLYVADPAAASVQVYAYPACTLVTTLSGTPLVVPMGVTDSYNFVP